MSVVSARGRVDREITTVNEFADVLTGSDAPTIADFYADDKGLVLVLNTGSDYVKSPYRLAEQLANDHRVVRGYTLNGSFVDLSTEREKLIRNRLDKLFSTVEIMADSLLTQASRTAAPFVTPKPA